MIELKEKMDLSLDGVTVTKCKKGQIISLSPATEKRLVKDDLAKEVKQLVVTKAEKPSKKGTSKK